MKRSSRLPGFYKLHIDARRKEIGKQCGLDPERMSKPLLDEETANHMIENVISVYGLPLGVALNFQINGKDILVPMCVEEPSVVAAASNAAKMIREGGGFQAEADEPIMISQVQLTNVPDCERARVAIEAHADEVIKLANAAYPNLIRRGGGTRGIEARILEGATATHGGMMAVHLFVDCRDAMGANLVNTIAEAVAPRLAELSFGRVGLRILSNLSDRRCVRVKVRVPVAALRSEHHAGDVVRDGIVSASRFAELDPYRAATHNKGIMNGVDSVVMATGNDWRGVEAGAHAFAAKLGHDGGYGPLATWRVGNDGALEGRLEIPLAVGTVGGTMRVHPGARLAMEILGVHHAHELAMVMAAAGLASNLAALRAMASDGIQRGHMSMHARSVALNVGATGDFVDLVAAEMAATGDVRAEVAEKILARLRGTHLQAV